MSVNLIKSLYRSMCKSIPKENLSLYRNYLLGEIEKFNTMHTNPIELKIKLSEIEQTMRSYLGMKHHIERENNLLQSYNINIIRDSKSEIERVASKVGLALT